jgi:diaminopimelate epimerase
MHYINGDGSLAEMCGNGVRCFGKYLVDNGFVPAGSGRFIADTRAGVRPITFEVDGAGRLTLATVDMGAPSFEPLMIPTALEATGAVAHTAPSVPLEGEEVDGADEPAVIEALVDTPLGAVRLTCVNMGNPHAVVFFDCLGAEVAAAFVANPHSFDISVVGPYLESHPLFPQNANIEFAAVVATAATAATAATTQAHHRGPGPESSPAAVASPLAGTARIVMRVWERGCGETLACGTGACATAVAAAVTGRAGRTSTLQLLGGDLCIEWHEDNHVFMTGPAVTVYEGTIELEEEGL